MKKPFLLIACSYGEDENWVNTYETYEMAECAMVKVLKPYRYDEYSKVRFREFYQYYAKGWKGVCNYYRIVDLRNWVE